MALCVYMHVCEILPIYTNSVHWTISKFYILEFIWSFMFIWICIHFIYIFELRFLHFTKCPCDFSLVCVQIIDILSLHLLDFVGGSSGFWFSLVLLLLVYPMVSFLNSITWFCSILGIVFLFSDPSNLCIYFTLLS